MGPAAALDHREAQATPLAELYSLPDPVAEALSGRTAAGPAPAISGRADSADLAFREPTREEIAASEVALGEVIREADAAAAPAAASAQPAATEGAEAAVAADAEAAEATAAVPAEPAAEPSPDVHVVRTVEEAQRIGELLCSEKFRDRVFACDTEVGYGRVRTEGS